LTSLSLRCFQWFAVGNNHVSICHDRITCLYMLERVRIKQ
jgi:hypothetical protein